MKHSEQRMELSQINFNLFKWWTGRIYTSSRSASSFGEVDVERDKNLVRVVRGKSDLVFGFREPRDRGVYDFAVNAVGSFENDSDFFYSEVGEKNDRIDLFGEKKSAYSEFSFKGNNLSGAGVLVPILYFPVGNSGKISGNLFLLTDRYFVEPIHLAVSKRVI